MSFIRSPNADTRRRGGNLIILGSGMAIMALVLTIIVLVRADNTGNPGMLALAGIIFAGAVALGRFGYVNAGAWLIVGISVMVPLFALLDPSGDIASVLVFLVLPVLLAGALLPPAQIWLVLGMCLVGTPLALHFGTSGKSANLATFFELVNPLLLLTMVALIGFVNAKGIVMALNHAQAAHREAQTASEALAAANTELEQRVEERTVALRKVVEEQEQTAAELRESLKAQQELNRIVAEMSVPVIPVSDTTLIVPLVGNIDSARANLILNNVLAKVEESGAHTVVLDVTGVPVVDSHVAGALLRVAQATHLMGTHTVLAGIRPEVAQALISLGVDLSQLHTVATLQEAL